MNFLADSLIYGLEDEAAGVYIRLGRLEELTHWNQAVLREQLGSRPAEGRRSGRSDLARATGNSIEYLDWVLELTTAVVGPTPAHCRHVVHGAYDLYVGAGSGDPGGLLTRCRSAFDREVDVPFPARNYLRLGEVESAFQVAALNLVDSPIQARVQQLLAALEPLSADRPHVHPERLALLDAPDAAERLGTGVLHEIHQHLVQGCRACERARPQRLIAAA